MTGELSPTPEEEVVAYRGDWKDIDQRTSFRGGVRYLIDTCLFGRNLDNRLQRLHSKHQRYVDENLDVLRNTAQEDMERDLSQRE